MTTPKSRTPTLPDLLAVIGTGMLGYGLWMYSPAVSLCVIGALFIVAGIFVQLSARREGGQ